MPSIEVDCLLRHCTDSEVKREQAEWQALHAVNVLKGKPLRGTFNFQITGRGGVSISAANSVVFLNEVYYRAGMRVRERFGKDVCIVPIPNSGATILDRGVFRTAELAAGIAQQVGAPCKSASLIRWNSVVGQTHKGERLRDVDQHKSLMRIAAKTDKPIVLFDDVVTSGSQLAAAKLLLSENGMVVVGMLAIAEVVNQGERSDAPGWRTANRSPFSMTDFMQRMKF